MRLIGVTGKPGTRKHGAAKEIVAELQSRGYKVDIVSLSAPLLAEVKKLIPQLRGETQVPANKILSHLAEEHDLPVWVIAEVQTYALQDVGEWNPDHGYPRSNNYVRKVLSAIAMYRRSQNEDYYLNKIIDQIERSDADWFVCADIRFSNEAEYFNSDGLVIHFERDAEMMDHFAQESDGDKYDTEMQDNDPIESALNYYDGFYGRFLYKDFSAKGFIDEVISLNKEGDHHV